MHSDPDQFKQLRKLMVLKRYEQPPPGYFDHFPSKVIARLEIALEEESRPWYQRLWLMLESRPAFAGAFGVLMSGLLIGGLVYSENVESGTAATGPILTGPSVTSAQTASLWEEGSDRVASISSTNPLVLMQHGIDLFNNPKAFNLPNATPEAVSYLPPGN
jgi:hypothetical protein